MKSTIILLLFGAAVLLDLLFYGRVWALPLGLTLFVWLMVVYLLGAAFVLATVLGTPGCEMRSYAQLATKLRGGDAAEHFCPGGVDFADAWGKR